MKEFDFPWSLGKRDLKHNNLKKKKKEKWKSREILHKWKNKLGKQVQTNDEETGKLPEKEFRIMIVKVNKNFENKNGENSRIY